jgi:putative hydrolase of the HAD superfamily
MAILPRAILFDLDDTILVAFGPAQSQWQRTIAAFTDRLGPIEATVIAAAIQAASTELWADPARHKYWRHRIGDARRRIVATAFAALAAAGHPVRSVMHWPTPITRCTTRNCRCSLTHTRLSTG